MSAEATTTIRQRHPASSSNNGVAAGTAVTDSATVSKAVPMWTSTVSGAALGIAFIIVGCCANVMTLEILTQSDNTQHNNTQARQGGGCNGQSLTPFVADCDAAGYRRDPGAGNLITFAQFLLIAAQGIVNHWRWPFGLTPRVVPLLTYAKITTIFFLTSLLNNKALDYSISIPVHTVFRSSGLCATLVLGYWGYRLRYPRHQVVACILVTVGILVVTVMDAGKGGGKRAAIVKGCCGDDGTAGVGGSGLSGVLDNDSSAVSGVNGSGVADVTSVVVGSAGELLSTNLVWATGIGMLTTALFLSAYLGHEQDRTYKRYGKGVWKEVMFYSHLLALPAFTAVAPDILHHLQLLAALPAPLLPVPFLPSVAPLRPPLLFVLFLNLVFQFVCIRGVYLLTTHSNTLTCNLLLTLRKLLSLMLSVTYFGNSFNVWQWVGSVLVFLGVVVYSQNPFGGKQMWASMIKSPLGSRTSTPERAYRELPTGTGSGKSVSGAKEGVVADEAVEQAVEEKADSNVRRRVKMQ